jgi:hypothetical protein
MTMENEVGAYLNKLYMALPFVVEIRCILDFIFSETALDPFQFW